MYPILTSDSIPASVVQHLASPIHLVDSHAAQSTSLASNSPLKPHCRAPVSTSRRQRTSRQSATSRECAPHAFDSLPWITALDSSADSLSLGPWDIADLSQISVPCRPTTGPLRRRRDSSRRAMKDSIPATNPTTFACGTGSELTVPSTPRTVFDPSRISFEQLMPVPSDESHLA
ncbi:hypothetical protein JOM56_003919 [Amanita muscaria]